MLIPPNDQKKCYTWRTKSIGLGCENTLPVLSSQQEKHRDTRRIEVRMPDVNPKADVLIVTVATVESQAVMRVFQEATGKAPKPVLIGDRIYHDLGEINGARVFMALSEMGTGGLGASQQAVQKGITALRPSTVIMVGIAFGVNEQKQSIGDVLVSKQLWLYDLQRIGKDEIIPRGDKPYTSGWLINYLRSADLYWEGAKVSFGLILTGEKLVDNVDYRDQLKQLEPEAIGGDMEGAGLYVACQDAHVDWILVKAICDWADGNKAQDKDMHQQLAAHNAASFVLHALQQAPLKPEREPFPQLERFPVTRSTQLTSSLLTLLGIVLFLICVLLSLVTNLLSVETTVQKIYNTNHTTMLIFSGFLVVIGIIFTFTRILDNKERNKKTNDRDIIHSPLRDSNVELGESFRRYFANVLNRPFYPLNDQVKVLEKAKDIFRNPKKSLIVILNGSGGVGKTTIAGELVRQSTRMGFLKPLGDSAKLKIYEDAGIRKIDEPLKLEWGELINTMLIQLGSPSLITHTINERENWVRRQLHTEKYLVLVDNLETNENARDIAIRLRELLIGSESRGLITYRYNDLGDLHNVRSIGIEGLNQSDSFLFLEKELQTRGYTKLEEWLKEKGDSHDILIKVIELTHGLPLALQLTIGLHNSLSLSSIYDLIRDVKTDARVEDIYSFLYREELRLLSNASLDLLASVFAKQLGLFRSEINNIVNLPPEQTLSSLIELGRFSLIQSVSKNHSDIGNEDFFFVHPMLHQLLNHVQIREWIGRRGE